MRFTRSSIRARRCISSTRPPKACRAAERAMLLCRSASFETRLSGTPQDEVDLHVVLKAYPHPEEPAKAGISKDAPLLGTARGTLHRRTFGLRLVRGEAERCRQAAQHRGSRSRRRFDGDR